MSSRSLIGTRLPACGRAAAGGGGRRVLWGSALEETSEALGKLRSDDGLRYQFGSVGLAYRGQLAQVGSVSSVPVCSIAITIEGMANWQ